MRNLSNTDYDSDFYAFVIKYGVDKLSKSEQTKLHLTNTAIECIAKYGYEKTSISFLSKKAKVSRPLITHYFPRKEEILDNCVQHIKYFERAFINIQNFDHVDPLYQFALGNILCCQKFPNNAKVWIYAYYLSTISNKYANFYTQHREEIIQYLGSLIKIEQGKNNYRKDINQANLAEYFYDYLTATIINEYSSTEKTNFTLKRRKILSFIEKMIKG